jgi:hypothetical protein
MPRSAHMPHIAMSTALLVAITSGTCMLTVSGCADRQPQSQVVQTFPYKAPTLAAKGNGWAEDANVRMTFSPKTNPSKTFSAVYKIEEPFMANTLVVNGQKSYDVTRRTVTFPYPALDFSARVTNNSDSPVRLSNAVVTYTFNGSVINLDQSRFEKFVKIVVPPKGTAEITVPGVLTKDLGNGDLEVGIFDASVGDRKANFKVTFTVSTNDQPIQVIESKTPQSMNDNEKSMIMITSAGEIRGFETIMGNWSSDLAMYENDTWKTSQTQQPGMPMFVIPR